MEYFGENPTISLSVFAEPRGGMSELIEHNDDTWDDLYARSDVHHLIVDSFKAAAIALEVPVHEAKRIWYEEVARQTRGSECDWVAVVELSAERLKRRQ